MLVLNKIQISKCLRTYRCDDHYSLKPHNINYSLKPLNIFNHPFPFQRSWEVAEILCSFRLVLEGKTGKEISVSSILEFLEKFLVHDFVLSDAEDNVSRQLNRGGIADLPLLRTLLTIH